jgi:threonine 3-dehydrogenase
VVDKDRYQDIVKKHGVNYIVHLAAILSSLGEQNPQLGYDVNVTGATNALNIARDHNCKIFIPSSIGVFGGTSFRKMNTPDDEILQPTTMYGVTKVFNELLGEYYRTKYGVDFRCIRYPGVISSEKFAFNGTTDYSTEIFFHALEQGSYKCWLPED